MHTPGLQLVEKHFAEFGQDYADAFLAALPEPGAGLGITGVALFSFVRRRKSSKK